MDDRKDPPQVMPAEDSKLPAAEDGKLPAAPMRTSPRHHDAKRFKSNEGTAVPMPGTAETPGGTEIVDIAEEYLRFKPGDRIEVKWTINDDEGGGEANANYEQIKKDLIIERGTTKVNNTDNDGSSGKCDTVWWAGESRDDLHHFFPLLTPP